MADDQELSPFDDDSSATQILQGLISPAPAQALVASPPDSPPLTKPGESTPLTGSLRTRPSQAEPKRLPDAPAQQAAPHATAAVTSAGRRLRLRRGLAGYFSRGGGGMGTQAAAGGTGAAGGSMPANTGLIKAGRAVRPAGYRPPVGSAAGSGLTPAPTAQAETAAIGWRGAQAARADLRDRALRAEVMEATNRPQPIGATDPQSGRRITQPTDNPAVNQALATDAMNQYRSGLEQAIAHVSGARLAASRLAKNPHRLAQKIALEGQPAETVSDYGAAQISVSSPAARDAVIAAIEKQFPVLRVKDTFANGDPEYGYRSYSMQLQMPNGSSQELQIVPREIFDVNREEHKKYKAARNAKLAGKQAAALAAEAKRENDRAMARFNMRNRAGGAKAGANANAPQRASAADALGGGLRKGAQVELPDGTAATVLYLDPNLKIARVRTAAGKNVTLRRKDLKAGQAEQRG